MPGYFRDFLFGAGDGRRRARGLIGLCLMLMVLFPAICLAGPYKDSAHGSAFSGVERSISTLALQVMPKRGNCVHCHELHGSIGGKQPSPAATQPSPHALFANPFESSRRYKPYRQQDVFCFYCHSFSNSQQISMIFGGGRDYSSLVGGASGGARGTLEVFNQDESGFESSYHNLYGVWDFSRRFSWYSIDKTPCAPCHNAHRAKRHSANVSDPGSSAVSRPTDPESLWGIRPAETMGAFDNSYEAPLYFGDGNFREPGRVPPQEAAAKTVNLVTFCLDCHQYAISSINQNRQLSTVDWSRIGGDFDGSGDKHGRNVYTGSADLLNPYQDYAAKGGFVLSCGDCHESHGSPNAALIRRSVNGSLLSGTVSRDSAGSSQGYLCRQCHRDDQSFAGIIDPALSNRWRVVHHESQDRPYAEGGSAGCLTCHEGQGSTVQPIGCRNCHGHGSYVDALRPGTINGKSIPAPEGGRRKTF